MIEVIIAYYKKLALVKKLTIPIIIALLFGVIFTFGIISETQNVKRHTVELQESLIPKLEKATNNILLLKKLSETLTFAVISSEKDLLTEIDVSAKSIQNNLMYLRDIEGMKLFEAYFSVAREQSLKMIEESDESVNTTEKLHLLLNSYNRVKRHFAETKTRLKKSISSTTNAISSIATSMIYYTIVYILFFAFVLLFVSYFIYNNFHARFQEMSRKIAQLEIKKSLHCSFPAPSDELSILSENIDRAISEFDILEKSTKEAEEMAHRDQLTKLYNRHYLNRVFKNLNENDIGYGLLFLDVDYFKSINDRYGHDVGDDVLIRLSEILQDSLRGDDVVGRWGGEEFMIIIVEATDDMLFQIAQKIRMTIEEERFEDVQSVTLSIGISRRREGMSEKDVIKEADEALYQAKSNGRNRVEMYKI